MVNKKNIAMCAIISGVAFSAMNIKGDSSSSSSSSGSKEGSCKSPKEAKVEVDLLGFKKEKIDFTFDALKAFVENKNNWVNVNVTTFGSIYAVTSTTGIIFAYLEDKNFKFDKDEDETKERLKISVTISGPSITAVTAEKNDAKKE